VKLTDKILLGIIYVEHNTGTNEENQSQSQKIAYFPMPYLSESDFCIISAGLDWPSCFEYI
jgi:hypothetical protein